VTGDRRLPGGTRGARLLRQVWPRGRWPAAPVPRPRQSRPPRAGCGGRPAL